MLQLPAAPFQTVFPLLPTKHALTAVQVRLSYLQILGELKMYSGKIFNATMMVRAVCYVMALGTLSCWPHCFSLSRDVLVDVGKGLCWRNSA